ncbi:hypothetical protein OSSY52_13610 [Tepiditoga spiralis]|uniref:Uncharacterized protein n=1 Tax=Tepiditoga spiralis TaxID=2108365 RepID=A0A7G1G421_9BACT|nr:hypothetical protein [Tepiditoga spiralis]BBE31220.1 hypothetical protein OSSY52_13610 [Tepiditoga spiralis]
MKKLILLIVILFSIFSFGEITKEYLNNFEYSQLIKSNDDLLKIIGYYKLYFKFGFTGNKIKAEKLFYSFQKNYNNEKDIAIIDLIKSLDTFSQIEMLKPIKTLTNLDNKYNNDLIKILRLEYIYKDWKRSGDPKIAKEIMNTLNYLKEKYGETVFYSYYYSLFNIESRLYGIRSLAYKELKNGILNFKKSMILKELFLTGARKESEISFIPSEVQKNDESLYLNIAKEYIDSNRNNAYVLLSIEEFYLKNNLYQQAKKLLKNLKQSNKVNKVLPRFYELLGDYSLNIDDKVSFYEKSLKLLNKNYDLWGKFGLAVYKQDPVKNKTLARIALNNATDAPNQPQEVYDLLKKLRNDMKLHLFLTVILPIILVFIVGITMLLLYEKRNKKKQREMMLKGD